MKPILDRLDEIQSVIDAATPEQDLFILVEALALPDDEDHESNLNGAEARLESFTSQSQTFAPQLVKALRLQVRALRKQRDYYGDESPGLVAHDMLAEIQSILCEEQK